VRARVRACTVPSARPRVALATLAVQFFLVLVSGAVAGAVGAYGGFFNNSVRVVGARAYQWTDAAREAPRLALARSRARSAATRAASMRACTTRTPT
jgi:hypothetical protein